MLVEREPASVCDAYVPQRLLSKLITNRGVTKMINILFKVSETLFKKIRVARKDGLRGIRSNSSGRRRAATTHA